MTWNEILAVIEAMSPEEREREAEVWPHQFNLDEPVRLCPVVALDRVGDLAGEDDVVHGCANWQRDDSLFVLLIDSHPYGPNGEALYGWLEDGSTEVVAWAPGANASVSCMESVPVDPAIQEKVAKILRERGFSAYQDKDSE